MLENIDLFRLAGERMRYLTQRQSVIARNIANADTPGYQAQDVAPFSFDSALLRAGNTAENAGQAPALNLVRTNPEHIALTLANQVAQVTSRTSSYAEKPDGNTVSIEQQMIKSADVSNGFALASAAYTKTLSLMETAIDPGK
ncbi:flagellar basal body rod protein FlgB [Rhodopila globiformis]|uniref:Flagellar basal body rod protein FlgB n=1 Tax=Rhodopila globiformis TaxID=1071 RepID=A0A2S6MZJ2_RHOGL|nr:flagellar basal body rod protein FlgB [Rhodopila globiformis]PPQ27772.1 flagellar basal-body rod protein FlgB [Rhodopila globiformis]